MKEVSNIITIAQFLFSVLHIRVILVVMLILASFFLLLWLKTCWGLWEFCLGRVASFHRRDHKSTSKSDVVSGYAQSVKLVQREHTLKT